MSSRAVSMASRELFMWTKSLSSVLAQKSGISFEKDARITVDVLGRKMASFGPQCYL